MPAYFESGLMVGESAWHGQGTVIPADDERRFSINDSIELAGLDWSVELGDCYYLHGPDGEHCDKVDGAHVTLRKEGDGYKPLGVVGSRYEPLQNREAFEWFQPWLDTKDVSIETAGSLEGGRSVWVMARILTGDLKVTGDDAIAKYVMLSTRHDGKAATSCGFTPVRIVCANTLAMAHRNNASKLLRVRHTANQHDALAVIRETIALADQEFNATGEQYRRMLTCKLSTSELRRYVKLVYDVDPEVAETDLSGRIRNRLDEVVRLATHGKGQDGDRTVWGAYCGVTEYLTHKMGKDAEKRLRSNIEGQAARINRRAYDLAVELSA